MGRLARFLRISGFGAAASSPHSSGSAPWTMGYYPRGPGSYI